MFFPFSKVRAIELKKWAASLLLLLLACSPPKNNYLKTLRKELRTHRVQVKVLKVFPQDAPHTLIVRTKKEAYKDEELASVLDALRSAHTAAFQKTFNHLLPLKKIVLHNLNKRMRRPNHKKYAKILWENGETVAYRKEIESCFLQKN